MFFKNKENKEVKTLTTDTNASKIAALIMAFSTHETVSKKEKHLEMAAMAKEIGVVSELEMTLCMFAGHLISGGDIKQADALIKHILSDVMAIKLSRKNPEEMATELINLLKKVKNK